MELGEFRIKVKEWLGEVSEQEVSRWHKALYATRGSSYTWDDARELLEKTIKRERMRVAAANVKEVADGSDGLEERIEEKIKKYQEAYIAETPNDLIVLRQMATIEIQLEVLGRELLGVSYFDGASDFQRLVELQKLLSTEYRQLQASLGIDRRTRDQAGGGDIREQIEDTITRAGEFYRQKMVQVEHCGIKVGHLLMHFDKWELKCVCPRCGKDFTVDASAMKSPPYIARTLPEHSLERAAREDRGN